MILSNKHRAIGTADARFNDAKYNYFKIFDPNSEVVLALQPETCYHQGDRAYGREEGTDAAALEEAGFGAEGPLDGALHRLRIARVLCERRVVLGGGEGKGTNSEMVERVVEFVYQKPCGKAEKHLGFNERCFGTLE